ncbi:DNA modification methylase [Lachnospiraceae bacterium PM6-15]|uniref:DNA-methyltransferase n=1 Tax=Ohessyouella blattaphilus TaxID=2949333 RepID=UPI003E251419
MSGIQMTLLDYFKDNEQFTLKEAEAVVVGVKNGNIKIPSIRARIYEGIDSGKFERVAKGVYTVKKVNAQTNKEVTCMLVQGDGRDLSFIDDNSIDAIITDHPYDLKASLKGGNRDFANYEVFRYGEKDMQEKKRVLKQGCFLVEFLPEENGSNYEYLYEIKRMAKEVGLEYYAKVAWKKGSFIANTGRKSKNTEEILFFTKGKARSLRKDEKKNKVDNQQMHYMSGANGMLPTVFDVEPIKKSEKIHQAEKPIELIRQILNFITKEGESVLDQFAGSFSVAEASFESNRNSVSIEINPDYFEAGKERITRSKEKKNAR